MAEDEIDERLDRAVQAAIKAGEQEAVRLQQIVEQADVLLQSAGRHYLRWSQPGETVLQDFSDMTVEAAAELREAFARRRQLLGTFNIAFFGRTGAGKSTLISAFAELDGSDVSLGESDWTTEVKAVRWRSCALFDTPGINGWGRTLGRAELELRAREAVQSADVVILCFDSQSQQETEFAKVASWVEELGKPALAVLNVRNQHWGQVERVSSMTARRNLTEPVQQHAQNIQDELRRIGLGETPIVAISARRALEARAADPFGGPDAVGLEKRRNQYGRQDLLSWSNFEALSELLAASVATGAMDLRLVGLREGVRGQLLRIRDRLKETRGALASQVQVAESAVEAALQVLGYPGRERTEHLYNEQLQTDSLTLLEEIREAPFASPVDGDVERMVSHLSAAHLGALRAESLSRAEDLIMEAFDKKSEIEEATFGHEVFNRAKIAEACEEVVKGAFAFAVDRMGLVANDSIADIPFVASSGRVEGSTGNGEKFAGLGLRVGGLGTGALGAVLGLVALTNAWNPVGWTAAGIFAALGLASAIASGFGRWFSKRAQQKNVQARSEALSRSRRIVHEAYDELHDQLAITIHEELWSCAAPGLSGVVTNALVARNLLTDVSRLRADLGKMARKLQAKNTPESVISSACRRVEVERGLADRPADLWLGELWIQDPRGLSGEAEHEASAPAKARRSTGGELANRFYGFLDSIGTRPSEQDASKWLAALAEKGGSFPSLAATHQELAEFASAGRPRVVVVGDYSSGKSSMIKRLLLDEGQPAPPSLNVRADPTTSAAESYPWHEIDLVDTPGLQSGHREHDRLALSMIADACLVIVVLHTNLVIGDPEGLRAFLSDDQDFVSKKSRALFVINRSDELGGHPADAPAEFDRLKLRKSSELELALRSLEIEVDPSRIMCIAADPFGEVGNRIDATSTTYDACRGWDGVDQLRKFLTQMRSPLKRSGVAIGVLHGGIIRLEEVGQSCDANKALADDGILRLESSLRLIERATREAIVIRKRLVSEAESLVTDHARSALASVLGAVTEGEIDVEAERLGEWWTSATFIEGVQRFETKTKHDIDRWYSTYSSEIGRALQIGDFRQARPTVAQAFDHQKLRKPTRAGTARKVTVVAETTAKGATRDVVYSAGKALGANFKPWGAVNLSAKVMKAGAVLGFVGVGIDIVTWAKDNKNSRKREAARLAAVSWVDESIPLVADQVSGIAGEGGAVSYLDDAVSTLRSLQSELVETLIQARARSQSLQTEAAVARDLIAAAWQTLPENERHYEH